MYLLNISFPVDGPYAPNALEIGADPSENLTEDDKLLNQIAPKFEPKYNAELDKPASEGAGSTVWTPKTDTGTATRKEVEAVQHSRMVEGDDKSEMHTKVVKVTSERAVNAPLKSESDTSEVAQAASPPDVVLVAPAAISEESKEVGIMEEIEENEENEVENDDIFGDESSDSSRPVDNNGTSVSAPTSEKAIVTMVEPATVSVVADVDNISATSDVLPVECENFNITATTGVVTHEAPLPSSERVPSTSPKEDGIVIVDAQV